MNTTENPQDKTCQINIHNVHGWELEPEAIDKAMALCARHMSVAKRIEVYPQQRVPADAPAYKHPGWLEWHFNVYYHSGGQITIGMIQRQPGAEWECHS